MENPHPQTLLPHPQTLDSHQQQTLNCPRCDSPHTKFCYYNNYNLAQPRHFCKNCRRYWTKGGALRNIPVGGGTRRSSKRPATSPCKRPTKSRHVSSEEREAVQGETKVQDLSVNDVLHDIMGVGSFSNLLHGSSEGQFGNFTMDILGGNGAQDLSSWSDLSIYTPGPTFQ